MNIWKSKKQQIMELSFAVTTLKKEKDELQLELERHKYKLRNCEKKMAELKEKERAYTELDRLNTAIIAALLELSGGTKDTPMIVPTALVNHAFEKLEVISSFDQDRSAWKMYCMEKK